jgi:glutamate racemase
LSILREIARQLPRTNIVYFADSAHVPYGDRTAEEIRVFSRAITAFLIEQGAGVVVVACNTASAAALYQLRAWFQVPIVGMEPAIKPAIERTRSQHVGVIATRATFQGELFAQLVERFARETVVHTQACPGLVDQIEAGKTDHPETEALLRQFLAPMLDAGIDSLVLGCTHYPFLRPTIERVAGPGVVIIDPAPAVARQTRRVLERHAGDRVQGSGQITYYTSGDPLTFEARIRQLITATGPVYKVLWENDMVVLPETPHS